MRCIGDECNLWPKVQSMQSHVIEHFYSPFPETMVLQMAFEMYYCTSVMYQTIRVKQLQASRIHHVKIDCILYGTKKRDEKENEN